MTLDETKVPSSEAMGANNVVDLWISEAHCSDDRDGNDLHGFRPKVSGMSTQSCQQQMV